MTSKGLFENEYHVGANQIRKDHKNILNRLRSIQEDADFVKEIACLFPKLPLVANERCGSWYIDPTERKVYSVYYKSTDGHMGQWDFNLRRSNLHLLDIIHRYKGCIVVDSTRRGKRIPDSLSKTIPIWCCAINRAVAKYRSRRHHHHHEQYGFFENKKQEQEACELYSLPSCVSRSEHAQIEARMDGFAQKLLDSGGIDMESISKLVEKPLRPLWFTPQSSFFINDPPDYSDAPFWPVICLSASQAVESGCQARPGGYLYVQGSGDDQEAWCHGLTPRLFWQHAKELLNSNSSVECEQRVQHIVASAGPANDDGDDDTSNDKKYDMIQGTTLAIGSRLSGKPPACWQHFDYIINCTPTHYEEIDKEHCYLQLPIPEGKKGQQQLFESIPKALAFVKEPLQQEKRILVHCAKGQDRSVGIALAILVKYFDQDMKFVSDGVTRVDKKGIHDHLVKIISSRPKAAPSRATLKKINTYFMS
ncbi:tRNA A64-2'-O-ribosylphosphate transferase [Zychaea mexicana]|uniref:tRNA A64-2'-O-ribosylphosphate transferase n=1 Tax=Zychaea mexicana TaxID=64656 RepID=UPI0022FEAF37|nr:tRNA A64-2'-O-ribosylphosphate transferase [Zychaea mexicana]KAI9490517.1 tRNA A64-2'-O-ribosylphosphate transferase [Zychaea mexicana]